MLEYWNTCGKWQKLGMEECTLLQPGGEAVLDVSWDVLCVRVWHLISGVRNGVFPAVASLFILIAQQPDLPG